MTSVSQRPEAEAIVAQLLAAVQPERPAAGEIHASTPLGAEGLGLDSVEIVEVLLACEDHFGRLAAPLLEGGAPLTFASVVDHFTGP